MSNDRKYDLPAELEEQWREWATSKSAIDESQLRRNLLERIPDRRLRRRTQLVVVAAAASLLAVLIGIDSTRRPPSSKAVDEAFVHETGSNVILVLREGNEPIYIATEASNGSIGE
jgi:hypothetical protein